MWPLAEPDTSRRTACPGDTGRGRGSVAGPSEEEGEGEAGSEEVRTSGNPQEPVQVCVYTWHNCEGRKQKIFLCGH